MSSFTEFFGLVFWTALIIFQVCWIVVIPIMVASFYTGYRNGTGSVWIMIAIFIAAYFLIPIAGGREGGLVYIALPFVIPLYILPLFGIGQLFARSKPKEYEKDGLEPWV